MNSIITEQYPGMVNTKEPIKTIINKPIKTNYHNPLAQVRKEEQLNSEIFDFVVGTCGNRNLTKELCLSNSLYDLNSTPPNKARTRRLDFVQVNPKTAIAYEVKEKTITLKDISEAIGNKGYLNLLKEKYSDKKVSLAFMGLLGIETNALRLIKVMSPSVVYISVQDYCYSAYKRSINNNHTLDYFYVQLQAIRYKHLFTPSQITEIENSYKNRTK